jgi:GNAT superfamily N-acetyltransferase
LARHPVPVMILARLAVDASHQGVGLGKALLKDAPKPLILPAFVPCWCMPKTTRRASGI